MFYGCNCSLCNNSGLYIYKILVFKKKKDLITNENMFIVYTNYLFVFGSDFSDLGSVVYVHSGFIYI